MKTLVKFGVSLGASLLLLSSGSHAAVLNFTGYIDNVTFEHAVTGDFTDPTYLNGVTVSAHGSTAVGNLVGGAVPGGFENYGTVPQAYFDRYGAGIGVCQALSGTQCNPANDDNVTGSPKVEILSTSFVLNGDTSAKVLVSNLIFRNDGHTTIFPAGRQINISTDGTNWLPYLLNTVTGVLVANPIFSLLADQFIHFQYNNQQFYLSSATVIRNPDQGVGEVPLPAAPPCWRAPLADWACSDAGASGAKTPAQLRPEIGWIAATP